MQTITLMICQKSSNQIKERTEEKEMDDFKRNRRNGKFYHVFIVQNEKESERWKSKSVIKRCQQKNVFGYS